MNRRDFFVGATAAAALGATGRLGDGEPVALVKALHTDLPPGEWACLCGVFKIGGQAKGNSFLCWVKRDRTTSDADVQEAITAAFGIPAEQFAESHFKLHKP